MPNPWRLSQLRDQTTIQTITATVELVPELSPAPDCVEVSATAAAANTQALYVTVDGRVPTSTDYDYLLAAGDDLSTTDRAEAAALTLRAASVSGSQTLTIRPRYIGEV